MYGAKRMQTVATGRKCAAAKRGGPGGEERDLVRAVVVEVGEVTFPSDRRAERGALALTADETARGEPVTGSGRSRSWFELWKMCAGHGAP